MILLGHYLSPPAAVVLALACYRITRFLLDDTFPVLYPLRERARRRWPAEPGHFTELLVCPWCVSVYVGAALVGWWWVSHSTLIPVALIAALSAVSGIISELLG